MLEGLRLVEVSAFVAAPFAGATLARMGADVVRVEQRGGGIDAHRWPVHEGRSLYREGLDQGKRSVAVDLRSPAGQDLVTRLIAERGIVVTNLGARGWMAYDRLREHRADLVMLLISGAPGGGTAVDYTVNAGIGFPWVTGPEGWEGPVNHVLPAWDVITGALAASAILAADRRRAQTGEGALVELALAEIAERVARNLGYLAEAALVPEPRGRFGNDLYGTYARDFETADGRRVMVCALTPRQWQSLADATGLGDRFAEIEREHGVDLRDEGERFRWRRQINALVEPWVASRPMSEVAAAFDAAGVLWGPYRTFKQVVEEAPELGRPELPSPRIGADTDSVLREELGLDAGVLAQLRADGVID